MDIYRKYYPSEKLSLAIKADLREASCPIVFAWVNPGEPTPSESNTEWRGCPFQTADARHRINHAFRLVRDWCRS
jgi:hypothetical protein